MITINDVNPLRWATCFVPQIQVDWRGAWVAGSLEGSMLGGVGSDNIFLVHFDRNGVHQWTVEHGGDDAEECWALQAQGGPKLCVGHGFIAM